MRWTKHTDCATLIEDARAAVQTSSIKDWLMSEIEADRAHLKLQSLDWLATENQAPSQTTEHLDSRGYWWFVWVLYRTDIQAAIDDLNKIVQHAHDRPARFDASLAELEAAHAWDDGCDELDFDIPDPSGDGDGPTYVLCSILALRRLLNLALSRGLPVVHARFSFRA